ncbi:sensor histidine kinase [Jonesia quinghaiensis]|uniref:sensor histidine kinase n=1 Tax=Jonesia quinghaiensis TaxID=262806 RepID=UPI000686EADA|nr:HAMP domain-containing sensor histidine kinase [Jonesia quinghaiensis]
MTVRSGPLTLPTLRGRLVTIIVSVALLMGVAVGTISAVALHSRLTAQLDAQLLQASERAGRRPPQFSTGDALPPPGARIPLGQAAGTISVYSDGSGLLDAGFVDANGDYQTLTSDQVAELFEVPRDGSVYTVSVAEIGSVRAVWASQPTGEETVTAIPRESVTRQVSSFVSFEVVIVVLAAGAAALVAWQLVSREVRPLDKVAQAATAISQRPLAEGDVSGLGQVDESVMTGTREVVAVGSAFNTMVAHVEKALSQRHRSETRLSQFVADASHELRTPLASVRGYAELLTRHDEGLPPDVADHLQRIHRQSQHMTSLVENLLLLARLDADPEVARQPVDATSVLMECIRDAHMAGRDHVWQLSVPDSPVVVLGDATRLTQIVSNILTNARVHTPAGTTVDVSLTQEDNHGVLTISDDGPGMDPDFAHRAFDRFARADTARSPSGSTGLGLAIVHALTQSLGGDISVQSSEAGTTFVLKLDAAPAPDSSHAEPVPPFDDGGDQPGVG